MKDAVIDAVVKQAAFLIRIDAVESYHWRGEIRCLSMDETYVFASLAELIDKMEEQMNVLEHPPEAWSKRSWLHFDDGHRTAADAKTR